jgi:hypothetical protein
MPFKHFLTTSLDFERTHQLILQCLFNDPLFLKVMTRMEIDNYQVQLEPVSGLFDIGILDNNKKQLCLIELKMWSNLSNVQLERQSKYLESQRCPGMHILLGNSDLQFHRDPDYDEISDHTRDNSCKIGYQELIGVLDTFIAHSDPSSPVCIIAGDYREALNKQAAYLDQTWLNPSANRHFRSIFQKNLLILRYLNP